MTRQLHPPAEGSGTGDAIGEPFLIERHIASRMDAPHWHDHVEINLMMSGRMTYELNGRPAHVERGHASMFWAAIPHRAVSVEPGSELFCIYLPFADFAALPLDGVRGLVAEGGFVAAAEADAADAILFPRWLREWHAANQQRRALLRDEIRQRVRRIALDPHVVTLDPGGRAQRNRQPDGRAAERAGQIVDLINRRFAEPLTLPIMARELGVHPATAMAAFRKTLGLSVQDYLKCQRLTQARRLLSESTLPIIDIAFACGFGSLGRFYAQFRREVGTTPRAFRLNPFEGGES